MPEGSGSPSFRPESLGEQCGHMGSNCWYVHVDTGKFIAVVPPLHPESMSKAAWERAQEEYRLAQKIVSGEGWVRFDPDG